MSLSRMGFFMALCAVLTLVVCGVALAQCSECEMIAELDPETVLNGFAVLSGAVILLFEGFRSNP